jgi:hypothetical protein
MPSAEGRFSQRQYALTEASAGVAIKNKYCLTEASAGMTFKKKGELCIEIMGTVQAGR